ncbi:hypothetical protein O9992_30365 [Vibrio lentus]|nr:hypothetical protein [Vibrio lentus]
MSTVVVWGAGSGLGAAIVERCIYKVMTSWRSRNRTKMPLARAGY